MAELHPAKEGHSIMCRACKKVVIPATKEPPYCGVCEGLLDMALKDYQEDQAKARARHKRRHIRRRYMARRRQS